MFDLEETYGAWLEDSSSYWANSELSTQLIEQISNDPARILDEEVWSEVLSSSCPPPQSPEPETREALSLVISGLKYWSIKGTQSISENEDSRAYSDNCREALEKYLFLTRLQLSRLDADISQVQIKAGRANLGHTGRQITELLSSVSRTLQGAIATLYPSTVVAKRSSLALLYLEPTCKLLQHEVTMLDKEVVKEIIRVLALGVKLQHQQSMVRTQLLQLLTYYEHAANFVVNFLDTLSVEFDHTSLAESVLRDLTAQAAEWQDSQVSANIARAKCVNNFVVGISQCMPSLVANNLSSIAMLLNSPFVKLRMGTIEAAPVIVRTILAPAANTRNSPDEMIGSASDLDNDQPSSSPFGFGLGNGEDGPLRFKPAFELVGMVEPRVNDANHFVRSKALQSLSEISHEQSMISRRSKFSEIAVSKMRDRSQLVRRQAMALMKTLMETHPQIMHAKDLSRQLWQTSYDEMKMQLMVTEPGTTPYQQLEAGKAFVDFTLQFIGCVEEALAVAETLLNSRSKSDILDAIDLLVYADAYGVEESKSGIRSIVHLVWAKADNDENNQISHAAVETYRQLFLTASPDLDGRRAAQVVAENLVYLSQNAKQSTLTSLERLLVMAVEENLIEVNVVSRLWGLYQTELDIDPSKRRGAAIVLGMMSLADRSIACSGISSVVNIGLKKYGADDYVLAAHSCIILKRSISSEGSVQRLPANYDFFDDIVSFLLEPADEKRGLAWIGMAKEALAAILATCECPSKVYTKLVSRYINRVFRDEKERFSSEQRMQLFSQLIYIVGEVALNLLVYLERSELEFKRRSHEESSSRPATTRTNNNNDDTNANDEEELMGGSASPEDDFQDILRDFRENVIFYSDKALLKPFTGIVTELCKSELALNSVNTTSNFGSVTTQELLPKNFLSSEENSLDLDAIDVPLTQAIPEALDTIVANVGDTSAAVDEGVSCNNPMLVISATQTLSKFMCVSSRFCEENLPLLVSLMSKHTNNVVRSNFVVSLGDVAICFNQLIDDHTEYLYDRLNDSEEVVQRTCIVALTFLILAGQIKVKGKLGEMAKTIVHPNKNISSLARMFFNELSGKENAIYNSFLDILSTLIHDTTLSDAKMNVVVKFLAKLLDKEKQMKKLTEKLLMRMMKCDSVREWNACVQSINGMSRKVDDNVKEIIAMGFTGIRRPGDSESEQSNSEEEVEMEVEP